jgi:hypothetical protein
MVVGVVKVVLFATSLAAALFWYKAPRAKAPEVSGNDSWVGGSFGEKDEMQILADAALQNRLNSQAASFATAAAILSAIDSAIPFF